MLTIRPTPLLAGLAISGDFDDLQRLYDALLEVTGDSQEPGDDYELPALAVLAVCHELRQAMQGSRGVEFVDNNLDDSVRQSLKILGPSRNIYYRTRIHLPAIIFVVMVLGDFIDIYSRSIKYPTFNRDIQEVQLFQAECAAALQSVIDPVSAGRLLPILYGTVPRFRSYLAQYVDQLTLRYLRLPPEKRRQQILTLARRINEKGADYLRFEADLLDTAAELHCSVADLESIDELPELTDPEW